MNVKVLANVIGELKHPRTIQMMVYALDDARAKFKSSCAPKAPAACMVYQGSAWNGGELLTVIIDRCICSEHGQDIPFRDLEIWVYDIRGEVPMYLGKQDDPRNADLLKEPGDIPDPSANPKPFLKN
jgi:hypothetical protein